MFLFSMFVKLVKMWEHLGFDMWVIFEGCGCVQKVE